MSELPRVAAEARPIGADEFAACMAEFEPFEPRPRLAAAVSGGADSTCLALLAAEWTEARRGEVLALIVDHRLRPGSSEEAARVRDRLGAFGVRCEILVAEGPPPQTRIEERARAVRYELLTAACRAHGLLHLLTGHHRQDLVETVAMRERRASGPTGLAGIARERFLAELRLLRPLLGFDRARLEATLVARGIDWERDPSNLDLRIERARLRAGPLDQERLLTLAACAARERRRLESDLARLAADAVRIDPLGWARIMLEPWRCASEELRLLLLERLLTTIGGRLYPPRRSRTAGALRHLDREPAALTIGGCIVRIGPAGLAVCREPALVEERRELAPGGRCLWDGRFEIRCRQAPGRLQIVAAGADPALLARVRERVGRARADHAPAEALRALPLVLAERRVVCWPPAYRSARGWRIDVSFRPLRRFLEAPFR